MRYFLLLFISSIMLFTSLTLYAATPTPTSAPSPTVTPAAVPSFSPASKPVAVTATPSPVPAASHGTSVTTKVNPSVDAPILQGLSLEGVIEDFEYSPEGRRDPFDPYTGADTHSKSDNVVKTPLQKYDLDQLLLVALLWNIHNPKAFIKDPTGASYTVSVGDKIGRLNGVITEIREGEVVVRETFRVGDKTNEQMRVIKINRKDRDTQ